ncbi:hypothetical protein LTR37_017121 [Vermiconidia calcicola]|uniref:Uncharacterized protein n=1 Tax=Vermiconidia calcicola TaxID=1690605 RepID=A0ACC3ML12_9PEZI|nr:hypothetical protein LTR37_017121 [Vermiconidia calcicola]
MVVKRKVLVLGRPLDYVDKQYLEGFQKHYHLDVLHAKDRAETKERLADKVASDGPYEALVIKMGTIPYEPFDEDLLGDIGPSCKIIASASAGYNEFDVDWMTRAGIWFCNTIDAVSEATADMAMFLILATARNTTLAEKQAREGKWKAGLTPSQDPVGKTLGIIGLGSIGKYLATKAKVFNMHIRYHNRHRLPADEEAKYSATYCEDLHTLLSTSDVVSIHTPLNANTTNMISTAEFEAMREGSFLVNTARGAVVDEAAMIQALESGKLARAGLDVFPDEPKINEYFMKSEKVVLQPHMGGLTESAFAKSQRECLENIKAFFEKGTPNSPVNRPKG